MLERLQYSMSGHTASRQCPGRARFWGSYILQVSLLRFHEKKSSRLTCAYFIDLGKCAGVQG